MKTFLSIASIAGVFCIISCTQCNNSETHTHSDGAVHEGHAHEGEKPKQESFVVNKDTLKPADTSTNGAKEKSGHSHSHDGKSHKH